MQTCLSFAVALSNTNLSVLYCFAYEYNCVRYDTCKIYKMCFKVRSGRAQGGCLTERHREFVPGRRTKDGERTRANRRTFGSWDSETESIKQKTIWIVGF